MLNFTTKSVIILSEIMSFSLCCWYYWDYGSDFGGVCMMLCQKMGKNRLTR